MKLNTLLHSLTLLGLAASTSNLLAQADPSVTVTTEATMAPNVFGSPSWNTWVANALDAAQNNLTSAGAAGPSQFNVTTTPLPYTENWVTGFSSWEGQAGAAAPYNGELGTRASFVGVINGNGGLISINNLSFTMSSSDPGDNLGASYGAGVFPYSYKEIGVINNPGGGYTYVTSGSSSQLVNEIISIGVGNAYASYDTIATGDDDPNLTDTDQQIIAYDQAQVPNGYDFTGTFSYGDATDSATFDFTSVPDATSSLALLTGSLAALAGLRRRLHRA